MIQQRTLKHVKVSQLGCCCWFINIELLSENCKLWWQILKCHSSLLKLVRHQVGYVTDSSVYSVSWSRRMWVFPSSVLSTGVGYIRASIIVCLPNDTTRYFGLVIFGSGVAGLRSALEIFKNSSIAIITKTEAYQRSTNCTRGGNNTFHAPVESRMQESRYNVGEAYLRDDKTDRVSLATIMGAIDAFLYESMRHSQWMSRWILACY